MEASTSAQLPPVVKIPALYADPWYMITILGIYLYFVTVAGPHFMEWRKPYGLKRLILAHNLIQVVSCVYVIKEVLYITDHNIYFFWKCRKMDSNPEIVQRYFSLAYFLFWLKISELIETVIFVLRKKQNQVSKLHIFHHFSTVTLVYVLINLNTNGDSAYYCVFLNSIVHVIMYSYYFVAAVADKTVMEALTPVKKGITVIQMTQFVLILAQVLYQAFFCGMTLPVFLYFTTVIAGMFYGFYNFYNSAYQVEQRRKSLTAAADSGK
ncbi:elongation of very long chain fatty acids protein 7 [Drosophila elegans]|uniref:elongation of very long chain fatty acids protein 7 n=1 Tax=Drosophila elegans TaxID=30023 RepID=UPI0007E75C14|nr:elongation of very long chain fatty acids protein 7 [Drosophila elegans]